MNRDDAPLSNISDEELGRRVRQTPTFRLAVACDHFAESATELRESDPEAFERLVDETKTGQTRVTTTKSVRAVVEAFVDACEKYAALGDDDVAHAATEELAEDIRESGKVDDDAELCPDCGLMFVDFNAGLDCPNCGDGDVEDGGEA